jgi:hypothetical protein
MQIMTENELWDVVSLIHCRTDMPIAVTPYRYQDGHRVVDVITNGEFRQTVIVAED